MKNKIRSGLSRELRSVRVSDSLKSRILAEAAESRFQAEKKRYPLASLAVAAALILVIGLSVATVSLRPENRPQDTVLSDGGGSWVWVSEDDALYHARRSCGGISGAQRMQLDEAKAEGRRSCGACIAGSAKGTPEPAAAEFSAAQTTPNPTAAPTVNPPDAAYASSVPPMRDLGEITSAEAEVVVETTAEPTPEVEVFDAVNVSGSSAASKSAGDTEYVWADSVGDHYHVYSSCNGLLKRMQISKERALVLGKKPCAACEGVMVWKSPKDQYYHADRNCSLDAEGAEQMDEFSASAHGATICPECCLSRVWMTHGGAWYHLYNDCRGMSGAFQISECGAIVSGKDMCPECLGDGVWLTATGQFYHNDQFCSGMRAAQSFSEMGAMALGKEPCPTCVSDEEVLPELDKEVWLTKGGVYCHEVPNCSGMKNAYQTTMKEAMAMGKGICPVCTDAMPVLVLPGDKAYYHTTFPCSGETGEDAKCISMQQALEEGRDYCETCSLIDDSDWETSISTGYMKMSAERGGDYLQVEIYAKKHLAWIFSAEPMTISMEKGDVIELFSDPAYWMTDEEAQALHSGMESGALCGFRGVAHDFYVTVKDEKGNALREAWERAFVGESENMRRYTVLLDLTGLTGAASCEVSVFTREVNWAFNEKGEATISSHTLELTATSDEELGTCTDIWFDQRRTEEIMAMYSYELKIKPTAQADLAWCSLDGTLNMNHLRIGDDAYLIFEMPDVDAESQMESVAALEGEMWLSEDGQPIAFERAAQTDNRNSCVFRLAASVAPGNLAVEFVNGAAYSGPYGPESWTVLY